MLEKLFLLFTVLFSGYATYFYRSKEGLIVLFCISVILFLKNRYTLNKKVLMLVTIWLIYIILITIKYMEFHPYFAFVYPALFFIAYFLYKNFDRTLFEKLEKIIYVLCIISLLFWFWQLFNPTSLYSFLSMINMSGGISFQNAPFYHGIVYSINDAQYYGNIPRNCGFCWEPGPFSIFIVTAMFFNLARENFRIKKNKIFWVLLITLFTTQSTTGFAAFFILVLWYIFNNPLHKRFIYISFPIIIILIMVIFIKLPFMQEKIISDYNASIDIESAVLFYTSRGIDIGPDRFSSFIIAWIDFINNPLLGYGGHDADRWTAQLGANVGVISGIGNIMARYGIFGLLVFLIVLKKSSKFFSNFYKYKAGIFWAFIIIFFAISFSLIERPIYIAILFFPFFIEKSNY